MQRMLDNGVSTRRGVMNAHLEDAYRSDAGVAALPNSERAQVRGVILPLAPSMTPAQVLEVCESLGTALQPVQKQSL
jgi:dTDP-4-amino-4,6-dideoxygalactose transaminase